ncbi:protein CONSERVED ONLY IN THE GREEN LINEAGE 160, chloroplastic [Silene latifolia]|uniref:protein CONSERVED ONLY IN THE GREEN LINEAGE 160, chloroplastic n=1 Tax=Silene latifolia TaxID=37657 RepID=UPI003D76D7E3
MAMLSSVTATMKQIKMNSQDPSRQPMMPTKIILPDKKPMKWSTGVAPGEYGGPPTSTKLRKYWGGEKEDPVTSSELIWNNDFMPRLQKLVQDMEDTTTTAAATATATAEVVSPPVQEPSGFLNLNRAMSLDSLEVDLSASLKPTPKPAEQLNAKAVEKKEIPRRRWKLAPTKREQEKWDRATKAATGGSDVMLRETKKPRGDPEVLAAQSREQYYKLKNKLQLLTVGIGSVGFVSAYISYTPEIALSFGAGFLGSLAYIRMLGNSIDSMASTGATRVMKGAANQPRLLVPVALVMIYNRWNEIGVPQYGLMHLELIPMLVGFFSYKIATFAQAIEEALPDVGKNSEI